MSLPPSLECFDYIVVGAGTSGCALAGRLSESQGTSILLLEAGPMDRNLWLHLPIGYYKTVGNRKYDWGYVAGPEESLSGRTLGYPRGCVVGGCGAINGLTYIRGLAADYDQWAELGNADWSWKHVEPYFRRIEGYDGESDHFGTDGPLSICDLAERRDLSRAFIDAANGLGLPKLAHFHEGIVEGVGYPHITVRNGLRSSTAVAYLKPALRRRTITLKTNSICQRILFDGVRALGVQYLRGTVTRVAHARREVILCAGAIGTPHILQASGVGPAALVRSLGIPVVRDMPGIGSRLQDHFNVELVYRLRDPISLNDDLRRFSWRLRAVARWLVRRDGPLVTSPAHVLAFVRSSDVLTRPDLQFHFLPISLDEQRRPHRFSAASLDVCQLNPTSHGVVQARSPDVRIKPSIRLESLATEFDRKTVVAGIKVARAIARAGPLARVISSELKPSGSVQTDDELLSFARQAGGSIYHPVGTCRMGSDHSAVVDQRLRVIGMRNMRISDCSIAPRIISGNTNACAIMIAERAADMIRQDARHLP